MAQGGFNSELCAERPGRAAGRNLCLCLSLKHAPACASATQSIMQVVTVDDYDKYCHYVAGLVGIGLSKLFGKQWLSVRG